MELLRDRSEEFSAAGVQPYAISRDSPWTHVAWMQALDLDFPLLSDWNARGDAWLRHRVRLPRLKDVSERSAFLVDTDGVVRGAWRYDTSELPDFDEILEAAHEPCSRPAGPLYSGPWKHILRHAPARAVPRAAHDRLGVGVLAVGTIFALTSGWYSDWYSVFKVVHVVVAVVLGRRRPDYHAPRAPRRAHGRPARDRDARAPGGLRRREVLRSGRARSCS